MEQPKKAVMPTKETKPVLQVYSGTAWKCTICHSILGFTDDKKEILRIKYKDFYCYVKGGEVTVLCRRCGHMNTVFSEEDIKSVPEEKK